MSTLPNHAEPFVWTLAQSQGTAEAPPPSIPGLPGADGRAIEAQPAAPQGGGGPGPAGGSPFGGTMLWLFLLLILVFMMVTSAMSGRKERKKREEMISSLKRNDRVQTAGGIIGSVVELSSDSVVLRVDESSNTRIRFAKSAIQQVIRESKDKGLPASAAETKPATEKNPV